MSNPTYISAESAGSSPVLMLMGNSMPINDFLIATTPSSVNGQLGSEYVINDGSGVIMMAPNSVITTSVAAGIPNNVATAWAGACLAVDPLGGQTYSAWKMVLPTTDLSTPIFSVGQVVITANAVQVPIFVTSTVTTTELIVGPVGAVSPSDNYLIANNQLITSYVPLNITGGVISNLMMQGQSSNTKISLRSSGSASASNTLFFADTETSIVRLGSTTVGADITNYGTWLLAGGGSPEKFVISDDSTTYMTVNTTSSTVFTLLGSTQLTGGLFIVGGQSADQLTVYSSNATTKVFNVNALTEVVSIAGLDKIYPDGKFIVKDALGATNFSVSTDSGVNHLSSAISVTNVIPIAPALYSVGGPSNQFVNVYATSGIVNTSDRRLKNELSAPADSACLEAVGRMRPVAYEWKNAPGVPRLGMMADEIRTALAGIPNSCVRESIPTDPESILTVNESQLIPVLVGAIKRLTARLDALEGRL